MAADLLEHLSDGSRNDASILVVWSGAIHREGLTSASLPIAHNSAV